MGRGQFLRIVGPAFDLGDEPGHQPPMFGAVGRAADVVLEDEILRVCLAPVLKPVGQQSRFATAGVAEQDQRTAIACRVTVKPLEIVRPADVGAAAGFGKSLVVARLAGERVGNILDWETAPRWRP